MTVPELTLAKAKESLEHKTKTFRASDFLTTEEISEVKKSNIKGKQRKFNEVDAYIAEIIARFGYDTYVAWKQGEIDEDNMLKYIQAERARETAQGLALKALLVASLAGAQQPTKSGHQSKSMKMAIKILDKEQQRAKGDF